MKTVNIGQQSTGLLPLIMEGHFYLWRSGEFTPLAENPESILENEGCALLSLHP